MKKKITKKRKNTTSRCPDCNKSWSNCYCEYCENCKRKRCICPRQNPRSVAAKIKEVVFGREVKPDTHTIQVRDGTIILEGVDLGEFVVDFRAMIANSKVDIQFNPVGRPRTFYNINKGDTPEEVARRQEIMKKRKERGRPTAMRPGWPMGLGED